VSRERKRIISAFGAVVYSSARGSDGAILKCRELLHEDPDRYFKRISTSAMNPQAHSRAPDRRSGTTPGAA
jgi:cysteine synthase